MRLVLGTLQELSGLKAPVNRVANTQGTGLCWEHGQQSWTASCFARCEPSNSVHSPVAACWFALAVALLVLCVVFLSVCWGCTHYTHTHTQVKPVCVGVVERLCVVVL